ncbi:RNA-binding transcriptional accessory protein [Luteibacter rhizovicinus DSM 16549]|uniref:RNA-binding transcriptional accessory protein n=1 Tax=Luteibacter rhizovicinus DSM 16549 TaxID=1440763 RepID=A0A0G9HB30_9GAMM|nr:Tex family protein [Luteibacter rhizovicinus]APG03959.1 RNA-binding transcriptional accessory protein [Luteibacter rhizovicinus DSM 16549]KLD66444.1 transcription accessory protein [Luteibacter rhizovicinus DSM 16549]KLD78926.1 transcription accessory protein [Xanthomonas hyacinthi DSM 19077]
MQSIEQRIAQDIAAKPEQVRAAVELLDGGATVPFIARYRKEVTGGLDDIQLRLLEERLRYLRELEDRRAAILESIVEQGKMTDALKADLLSADTKARLEDLYLPYKPKRRTKAQIAREAGLEPLALGLRDDPTQDPETVAAGFVDAEKGIADTKAALDGARAILMESIAEDAALVGELRDWLWDKGQIRAVVVAGKENEGAKFRDYFDHSEAVSKIPSHRLLALMRARNEGVLEIDLNPGVDADQGHAEGEGRVAARAGIVNRNRAADAWLRETVRLTWRVKLHLHLTLDLFGRVREGAEDEAIRVFGDNLKDLLLAAPAGAKTVMGLDPGIRTGCKLAIVDATGKLLAFDTIYPHEPRNQWDQSVARIAQLSKQHGVNLIAIGNGTASRETDKLAAEVIKKHADLNLSKVVVSEAGASVYSASELASKEFPELDVSIRGAVSIARRLQDPLAELVKIEPKAIGVGQYQHDVNQVKLARALDARVEDCVNAVGVDVNTASAPLLARVAGLSSSVAENVVKHRDANGPFPSRKDLLKVPRLGDKAFEQCAGFLRISAGSNPLDASSVHPEAYPVVERILKQCGREVKQVIGDTSFLRGLKPEDFTDATFGVPTVRDILKELEKPGRDPRPEFVAPSFAEGVEDLKDLAVGMVLEGRVTNVAAFGAFVDIGVHQDGLVHVSALSHTFVKDPRDAVKAGDVVKVKVMEVDLPRKRIALSMRLDDVPGEARSGRPAQGGDAATGGGANRRGGQGGGGGNRSPQPPKPVAAPANSAFADAFNRAQKK